MICLPGEEIKRDWKLRKRDRRKRTKKERRALEEEQQKQRERQSFKNLNYALETAQKLCFKLTEALQRHTESDGITGEVIIGLGLGNCILYHAGGVFQRAVSFAVGEALGQAQASLSLAASNSGIVLSLGLWKRIQQYAELMQAQDEDFEGIDRYGAKIVHQDGYVQILKDTEGTRDRVAKDQPKQAKKSWYYYLLQNQLSILSREQRDRVYEELENYTPKYFRAFLDTTTGKNHSFWEGGVKQGNYQTQLTIMALSIELEGAFESHDALVVLQTTVEIIQKQIYKMGGSLSKVYFEDDMSAKLDNSTGGL